MPNSAFTENRTEAARAFVEHLRRYPAEARQDPAALAARFGLETEFVRRALVRLPDPERAESRRTDPRASRTGGLVASLDETLERAAANPLRFELLTLVVAFGTATLLTRLLPAASPDVDGFHVSPGTVLAGIVVLGAVAAQMVVFYLRRMVRYALYGGLMFGVAAAIPTMVSFWVKLQSAEVQGRIKEAERGLVVFSVGIAMLFVGLLYAGVAALASLLGGWVHLKRADDEWERLSRQELLERYFELQRRLEHSPTIAEAPQGWETWPVVRAVKREPLLSAGLLGLGAQLVHVVLGLAFGAKAGMVPNGDAYALLSGVHTLDALVLLSAVAFLARSPGRATATAGAFAAGWFVASLVPLGGFGPAFVFEPVRLMLGAMSLGFVLVLGALVGAGATVQRREAREGRLQRNDGATLVAEMLEIQWRLEEDATSVTVLVVDAAKSTAMKVGADPLDVEYSFREYQMWIAEVCAGFGGRIHSVAGDGAVVAFADATAAMGASRRLQTAVARFNEKVNRLPKPFRLRLGLHAGRVAGDLNDVQFTEVIDIAAHVEEIAPVGGIAATAAVVTSLGEEGFLPLSREVDGQPVFIALAPTETRG